MGKLINSVLITNDDGYNAKGIKVLYKISLGLFDKVWILAPKSNQSGKSHSITINKKLSINKIKNRDIWQKLCIIPMSSNFYININSLRESDKYLLSSAINQSNLNEATMMIKETPIEGFASVKDFLETFNLQQTELPIALDITSNIFIFNGTINHQGFSYDFKTLIKKENTR